MVKEIITDPLDEEFYGMLVASERVGAWCDVLRLHLAQGGPLPRLKQAVRDLAAALDSEAYAEAARGEGAFPLLTALLKHTDDDELLGDLSDALASCSGQLATKGKVRAFTYGGTQLVLKEGALGDGVGAKVWTVAHLVCRELAAHPEAVRGATVLEIGAGCGACGILAAKLGAAQVVMTDYVDAVLRNLRACVHLNSSGGAAGDDACSADVTGTPAGGAAEAGAAAAGAAPWDAPPMHVRFYDWQDELAALSPGERAALEATPGMPAASALPPGGSIDVGSNDSGVPGLEAGQTYEFIIGTDILYEWPMVKMVPAVLQRRLRPGGRALLCCAVREQAMFDVFAAACRDALGLRVGMLPVLPAADDLLDIRQEDYEGGYVLLAVEHVAAPAASWWRDDLFGGAERG